MLVASPTVSTQNVPFAAESWHGAFGTFFPDTSSGQYPAAPSPAERDLIEGIQRMAACLTSGGITADRQFDLRSRSFIVSDASWTATGDGGACLRVYALSADLCPFELAWAPVAESAVVQEPAVSEDLSVPTTVRWIKDATGLPWERIARLMSITRQALYAWERGGPMLDAHRRRLLAVYDVLRRASRQHSTPEQLAAWLDLPRGADARTPAQLLEAGEIDRARYLAVSSPSPRLRPAPSPKQPVPPRFRAGAERRQVALPPDEDAELLARFGEPGADDEATEGNADR